MNEVTKIKEPETTLVADPMVDMIERVLLNPDLPVERIAAVMDLQERQMDKAAEQAFNQAFAEAMAEMPDIPKTGKNKHTGNRYSTLDDLIRTTRPILSRHGLSLNWEQVEDGDWIRIMAVVRHALGYKITTQQKGQRDNGKQMNNLQGGGSTETYLKRYTGFAILGLSSGDNVDDDGSSAQVQMLTAEQFVTLRDKIAEIGIDPNIVLKAHSATSLETFPANQFNIAMKRLSETKVGGEE